MMGTPVIFVIDGLTYLIYNSFLIFETVSVRVSSGFLNGLFNCELTFLLHYLGELRKEEMMD